MIFTDSLLFRYAYDGLDRLLQATVTIQTATSSSQTVSNYTYGATGNLLTSPAGAYSYDGFSGGAFVNPHAATFLRQGSGGQAAVGLHTPQAAPALL